MPQSISVGELARAVNSCLEEYADTAADTLKTAVKDAAKTVQNEIEANAPEDTGRYAKSWKTKTTKENASALEVTVYSKTQYRLTHLLEHGHAKRGGGRTTAQPHIAPAEQNGIRQLESEIRRKL